MKPGTVFRWPNFPFPQYGGEIKARWFIYLGDSGILISPTNSYLISTTTQTIKTANCFTFQPGSSPFDEVCILNYDEQYYSIEKSLLVGHKDIEVKGELDHNTMRIIYNKISLSKFYSKKVLQDIHQSLNNISITGLRNPK